MVSRPALKNSTSSPPSPQGGRGRLPIRGRPRRGPPRRRIALRRDAPHPGAGRETHWKNLPEVGGFYLPTSPPEKGGSRGREGWGRWSPGFTPRGCLHAGVTWGVISPMNPGPYRPINRPGGRNSSFVEVVPATSQSVVVRLHTRVHHNPSRGGRLRRYSVHASTEYSQLAAATFSARSIYCTDMINYDRL